MREVDKTKVDLVRLQDDVAQVGQGLIADRDGERLGRADVGVIAIRRLWTRELGAFLKGQPTKTVEARRLDRAARLGPRPAIPPASAAKAWAPRKVAEVIDVRPHVEIAVQLKALHAPLK